MVDPPRMTDNVGQEVRDPLQTQRYRCEGSVDLMQMDGISEERQWQELLRESWTQADR